MHFAIQCKIAGRQKEYVRCIRFVPIAYTICYIYSVSRSTIKYMYKYVPECIYVCYPLFLLLLLYIVVFLCTRCLSAVDVLTVASAVCRRRRRRRSRCCCACWRSRSLFSCVDFSYFLCFCFVFFVWESTLGWVLCTAAACRQGCCCCCNIIVSACVKHTRVGRSSRAKVCGRYYPEQGERECICMFIYILVYIPTQTQKRADARAENAHTLKHRAPHMHTGTKQIFGLDRTIQEYRDIETSRQRYRIVYSIICLHMHINTCVRMRMRIGFCIAI